jgi:superfamily II DNA or RNA helicase
MLVYQKVGSGKTISGISIINSVINFINTNSNIYILAPKSILNDAW